MRKKVQDDEAHRSMYCPSETGIRNQAMAATIWINKTKLSEHKVHEAALPPLGEGAVRLRVESFSVTANNVSYAVIGGMFRYWDFFPASEGYGVVPMWGHAVVEASNHGDVAVGERVYGYLPMATHLDIIPGHISRGQLTDMTAHRQPMSAFYNQYSRLAADPEHDPAREAQRMIFGPLFKTGFLLEAMFHRENWFGAEAVVMTSASSKTSMALASVAREKSPEVKRIGLTSTSNVSFVTQSGLYNQVLTYEDVNHLTQVQSVSVDFAGNSALLRAIHETLGDNLKYSALVGATHVEGRGGGGPIPGPAPTLFFAPDHAANVIKELGARGFGEAVAASWSAFVATTDGFVRVDTRNGISAAAEAFQATLAGTADPAVGIIIRP
jgi:Protein of unknown function (DUF2855)